MAFDSSDPTVKTLQQHRRGDAKFGDMVTTCLESICELLNRQYRKYFEGNLKSMLEEKGKSTRLNNIDFEELMGMFGAGKNRAPTSTLCYLSSKIRAQKNKIIEYLDNIDNDKRDNVVAKSVSLATKSRVKKRLKSKDIQREITERETRKQDQRKTRDRKI